MIGFFFSKYTPIIYFLQIINNNICGFLINLQYYYDYTMYIKNIYKKNTSNICWTYSIVHKINYSNKYSPANQISE